MSALREFPHLPELTRQERSLRTAELFEEAAGTSNAETRSGLLDEVVLVNVRVAHAVAQRFTHRGIDADDLDQVAYEGLVKAAGRFDRDLGRDFLSFAVPTMRGELQRHFRDSGWMIRPTRRVQEQRWQLTRTEGELAQSLGRTPSAREVGAALGLTAGEHAEASTAYGCFRPASLDQPLTARTEGDATVGDLVPDDGHDRAVSEARMVLAPVMRRLSARDRRVVYLRYFEDLGQRDIGADIGVTQTQVSRILDRVLGEMREDLCAAQAGRRTSGHDRLG